MRDALHHRLGLVLVCILGFASFTATLSAQDGLACESRKRAAPVPLQMQFESKLQPLKQCTAPVDDLAACNRFVGRALEILYKNSDFKNGSQYFLANDIANGLSTPGNIPGWTRLGEATDQSVLDKAQALANEGAQVVAVKPAPKAGHVVLILPGSTEQFNLPGFSWGSLRAPNSASFFLNKPDRVFIGCPLSATWRAPAGVIVYSKK